MCRHSYKNLDLTFHWVDKERQFFEPVIKRNNGKQLLFDSWMKTALNMYNTFWTKLTDNLYIIYFQVMLESILHKIRLLEGYFFLFCLLSVNTRYILFPINWTVTNIYISLFTEPPWYIFFLVLSPVYWDVRSHIALIFVCLVSHTVGNREVFHFAITSVIFLLANRRVC